MWLYTLLVCGLMTINAQVVYGNEVSNDVYETGKASYYGKTHNGRKTKSGAIFDPRKLTAAHNRLPMGTIVQVRSKTTGKSVIVEINDTGGFGKYGRIIDLSERAANIIGINHNNGIAMVEIRILHRYVMRF